MKRFFISLALTIVALTTFAQTELPVDPNVRIGKLDNGLTYYIRHNDQPAQRAEFYLATNVGAFQEEDDQDGLAHFLEHMCFNGTKNFPGKKLLEYLQSIGAEFGQNINASTGFEQTQYMLNNIPIIREGIIDSCLLVLHDYAHYVTCDPKEIDAERGVILEERRSRRNADWRLYERTRPYYYGDTHMARRTLIGGEEQLKTFKYESLTNFYHKWYHPDMQAVVVVGDFDVDMMEQKIKERFSSIPAPETPTVKPVIPIPGNEEPVVAVITDPEATKSSIELLWKSEAMPKEYASTDIAFVTDIIESIISDAFAERMEAIKASPNAPFIGAGLDVSSLVEGTDAVMATVSFKGGEYKKALEAFYTEIERFKRYGITEGELERAIMELISNAEREVEAASTRDNPDYVYPILGHFFYNDYMLEPEMELQLTQAVCEQMSSSVIKQIIQQLITDENFIVIYSAPEREGLVHPTEAELLAVIEQVKTREIEAPAEENANEPLLNANAIKEGKIKNEKEGAYGSFEWTLKNGVKVVCLPTTHKNDEVLVSLVMNGGRSLIETAELPSFEENIWTTYRMNRGLSKFSGVQLKKQLAGKNVHLNINIEKTHHGINLVSTPKDLEFAMQMLYLNIVDPRYDEEEYNVGLSQIKAILPNLENLPQLQLQRNLYDALYGGNERALVISPEIVEKASIKDVENVCKRLFGNVAGATVYIVGNIDAGTLKPLVTKYIASLPGGKKGSKFIDRKDGIVEGKIVKEVVVPMETPKSTTIQVYTANIPYSIENDVLLNIAKLYLDMVYVETLRESEGGTYGASVVNKTAREPKEMAMLHVVFETNPESVKKLSDLAVEGVHKLITDGIPADKFDMIIQNIKKNIPQDRISNIYWVNALRDYVEYGDMYDSEYEKAVDNATPEAVVELVKNLVDAGNFIQLTMSPEE